MRLYCPAWIRYIKNERVQCDDTLMCMSAPSNCISKLVERLDGSDGYREQSQLFEAWKEGRGLLVDVQRSEQHTEVTVVGSILGLRIMRDQP